MNKSLARIFAGMCVLTLLAGCASTALAQTEVKEKPPMYTYVGDWAIPRAQWGEMEKTAAANNAILQKALAAGTIVAYGDDAAIVHQADGFTHDDFWSSMSMAGLMNVLDQFMTSGASTTTVLNSATKHVDAIFVSRYYNWKGGSVKGAYTRGSSYKLKADAPRDAVDSLSKSIFVPLMEKLLADGAITEYEIDTQAIHTESPDMFWIFFITPNADGLDKANAALQKLGRDNAMALDGMLSMMDWNAHRDELARTNATYK